VNARIERLRALIEEPLLVTNPKNVVYLAGFESSNAALLVDQERVQLFTDFRYLEAARAVEGVELVQTKRGVIGALATVNIATVVVALAAGVAGMLAFESRASFVVGVAISVTTIPAAAYIGVAAGLGQWDGSLGALAVLLVNLAMLLLAGTVTLTLQALRERARGRRALSRTRDP